VAVNGDLSVRRLKGAGRPIMPVDDRVELLAALQCVDYVTIFDEETAGELISQVRPQVYVKGGDYSAVPTDPNFPPEGHIVLTHGGSVEVVDYVPGHSTTELLERVLRAFGKCPEIP
jgi:D-beta-D-heptose 7-phosphate kinase/D-beta-D-heptose 1-phosphate adenosyltransferase